MKTIDLHGTKHEEAENRLIEFVVFNEPPFRIVTGNSAKMKEIVQKVVDKYEYYCYAESAHNQGSVIVTEKEW
jgi:DNA-nicking Smr family endonuclease